MQIGTKHFDFAHHTYIMGILNATPDSFSDGGNYQSLDAALRHTEQMIKEGADIIDIGGESTRPGYTQISEQEEIERVSPIIEALRKNFDIVLSLDTYKSKVAEAGIKAGADLINDIWGCKYDSELAAVIAGYQVSCCLMHNRNREANPYQTFMQDILSDLQDSIDIAKQAGISDSHIIIDPGIGFGKTVEENLYVMKHLNRFAAWGYPVLLGTSRKSMIGKTLDLPVDERLEGTLATTVLGVLGGCGIIRVHDVLQNKRVIMMTEAIKNSSL